MKTDQDRRSRYRRNLLRAEFQSLFWAAFLEKKRKSGLKLSELAERLGIHKSYVSRSFSSPPNWQVDKISDFADALDLQLEVRAIDRSNGQIFTPQGKKNSFTVSDSSQPVVVVTSTKSDPAIRHEVNG